MEEKGEKSHVLDHASEKSEGGMDPAKRKMKVDRVYRRGRNANQKVDRRKNTSRKYLKFHRNVL